MSRMQSVVNDIDYGMKVAHSSVAYSIQYDLRFRVWSYLCQSKLNAFFTVLDAVVQEDDS